MFRASFLAAVCLSLFASSANAALHDRGNGMIYDDILDVTWLQDANYSMTSGYDANGRMSQADALIWADQLVYGGHENWRLPNVLPINTVAFNLAPTNNATSDEGYADSEGWLDLNGNIASELGHLFYVSLANLGFCDPANATECNEQDGWLIRNHTPFINIETSYYWTGTAFFDGINRSFQFGMGNGNQTTNGGGDWYAWALHDGDIAAAPVPVPPAILLFTSAIIGLGLRRG